MIAAAFTALFFAVMAHAVVYQEAGAFVADAFTGKPPEPKTLWLDTAMQAEIVKILGHRYSAMRVRYWGEARRSAWILEEIGKEEPITVGIVINQNRIELVKVLAFRESRGGEVRHPFFTDQFKGAGLQDDRQLDRSVDGISGATLSVRALTKLSRLALYLDGKVRVPR
jgi:hypothetical protein